VSSGRTSQDPSYSLHSELKIFLGFIWLMIGNGGGLLTNVVMSSKGLLLIAVLSIILLKHRVVEAISASGHRCRIMWWTPKIEPCTVKLAYNKTARHFFSLPRFYPD